MGSQPLGDRKRRRIERATGLSLVRAVAHGGDHIKAIVTTDHRHGWYDPADGTWGFDEPDEVFHFTSCETFFPGYKEQQ